MIKPRIIIADTDINYLIPLQFKFVEQFFEKIELEIISDKEYYDQLFSSPQKVDILIVSEELYNSDICRHNIGNIFLMTEQNEEDQTDELNVNRIFKYTSIKEIVNEIIGKSVNILNIATSNKKEPQIIVVYSASGGVGKTTVSLGISTCLTKNYKRVFYMNAEHLQSFQRMLDNPTPIATSDVYNLLINADNNIYDNLKHVIRQELFSYLPPFKSALFSLRLNYSIYEKIAIGAKKSAEYDFIIIDADTVFDEDKIKLLDIADKVIIVTNQTSNSAYSTNLLLSNINVQNSDKYIFICNNFDKEKDNALIISNENAKFTISDYIDHISQYDNLSLGDLAKEKGMQRTAFLVI